MGSDTWGFYNHASMFRPFWHGKLDLTNVGEIMNKIFQRFVGWALPCWVKGSTYERAYLPSYCWTCKLEFDCTIYSFWMWVYWTYLAISKYMNKNPQKYEDFRGGLYYKNMLASRRIQPYQNHTDGFYVSQ